MEIPIFGAFKSLKVELCVGLSVEISICVGIIGVCVLLVVFIKRRKYDNETDNFINE